MASVAVGAAGGGDAAGGARTALLDGLVGGTAARGGGAAVLGALSVEQSHRLAAAFDRCRDTSGFVSWEIGKRRLESTNLEVQMLQNIWHLSDLDRDGRLSLREFVCAMYLSEQVSLGRSLPAEVRPDQQALLARSVEPLVSHATPPLAAVAADEAKPPCRDDFKSIDLHCSGCRREHVTDADSLVQQGKSPEDDGVTHPSGGQISQMAAIFEAVGQVASQDQLEGFSLEVVEERRGLVQQLSRRHQYAEQLREVHAASEALCKDCRRMDTEGAAVLCRVSHSQRELAFVEAEARGAEEDLHLLRGAASVGTRRPNSSRSCSPGNSRSDWRRLQQNQASVLELQAALEEIRLQKAAFQSAQLHRLEKQRHAEQDREHMLAGIEAEHAKFSMLRAHRLQMLGERSALEMELSELQALPSQPLPSAPTTAGAMSNNPFNPFACTAAFQLRTQAPQLVSSPPGRSRLRDGRGIRHQPLDV